jgi:TetR/AcrR family transcriptional regulator, transcriptional repressor for nem operon
MTITTAARERKKLTPKGEATRARILEQTAELIYRHGVHWTNNEQVRKATGVSGSQLNHYFPTKEDLVRGVIEWQADRVLSFHRSELFDGFRKWIDFYVGDDRPYGCSLGSLASEIIKTDLDVRDELAEAFTQWHTIFRDGLARLQEQGQLSERADPERLANLLLAAFQGGMLLAQIAREITPLRDALTTALDYMETFEITKREYVVD